MYLYNSKSEVRGFYNAYHNALNLDMEMLSKVFFLHVYLAIGAMSTDRYRIKKHLSQTLQINPVLKDKMFLSLLYLTYYLKNIEKTG